MDCLDIFKGKRFQVEGYPEVTELRQTAKIIMVFFIERLLHKDITEPLVRTQSEMAADTGVEYRTVMKCIKDLVECGFLICGKEKYKGNSYRGFIYYGRRAITVDGVKYEGFCLPVPDELKDIGAVESIGIVDVKKSYVYVCTHNGDPVYVGKGKGDRDTHCLSGRSSSSRLNKLFFDTGGVGMNVKRVFENISSEEASVKERNLIDSFKSLGYKILNVT